MKFLFVILCLVVALGSGQDCSEKRTDACFENLLSSLSGGTSVDKVCGELQASIACLREAVNECQKEEDEEIEEAMKQLEKMLSDNCVQVSNESLAERCDEDNVQQCLFNVFEMQNVGIPQGTGSNFIIDCSRKEHALQCIKSCEADVPILSKMEVIFNFTMDEYCGEYGKMLISMVPCLQANAEALFDQCKQIVMLLENMKELSKEELECIMAESSMCVAKFSKEKCKNGEAFENAMEKRMEKKLNACSGAGYLANSFLTLATFISAVLIRNKLQ